MRALTQDELREVTAGLVHRGIHPFDASVSTLTVTAGGGQNHIGSGGGGGSSGGGSTGGGGPIGGGGGGTGGLAAGAVHTTPGGTSYTTHLNLNQTQVQTIDQIVDYGNSHGKTATEIKIAVNQAFYESSLGTMNSNGSHFGLYQYSNSTWSETHGDLNINSQSDQVTAIYQDLATFEARYATGQANGAIPGSLSFDDYFEIKHHLGGNSTDWTNPVINGYESASSNLGYSG